MCVGILSDKLPIFHRPINVEPNVAVGIVKVFIVLQNVVRNRDGYLPKDTTTSGFEDLPKDPSSLVGSSS